MSKEKKEDVYLCQDNDNQIKVKKNEEGLIDELWIKADGDTGWVVISWIDFQNALGLSANALKGSSKERIQGLLMAAGFETNGMNQYRHFDYGSLSLESYEPIELVEKLIHIGARSQHNAIKSSFEKIVEAKPKLED